MRGNGYGRIVAQNIAALKGQLNNQKRMSQRLRMCWKCQKDKSTAGGDLKIIGGFVPGALARFICKDCIEAKQTQLKGEE